MRRFSEIFLDYDGVLFDFHSNALRMHGKPELSRNNWPLPGGDLSAVLGYDNRTEEGGIKFWDHMYANPEFWKGSDPFPWLHELIDLVKQHTGPHGVTVLTAVSHNAGSRRDEERAGKMHMLAVHGVHLQVKFEHQKWKCARPNTLLIDDWEQQVNPFKAHGGEAVLFPQPWNEHHVHPCPITFLRNWLKESI